MHGRRPRNARMLGPMTARRARLCLALAVLSGCSGAPVAVRVVQPVVPIPSPAVLRVTFTGTVVHLAVPDTLAFTTVLVHGERGDLDVRTDARGHADLDLATLPPALFPYRRTLARLEAPPCPELALQLPAEVAARLVVGRQRLDDADAWLAVHPGAAAMAEVKALRQDLLRRDLEQQRALAVEGTEALDHDRFVQAKAAVEACGRLAYGPIGVCEELDAAITRKFVRLQGALVEEALGQDRFEAAEAAAWRCRVASQEEVQCHKLAGRIVQARADHARRNAEAALGRKDFGLALTFAERCVGLAPELAVCAGLKERVLAGREVERQREVGKAVAMARRAVRRRQWRAAVAAWEQCVVRAPERAECAAGLARAEGMVRRGRTR
jgi:hypothetical protein